MKRKIVIVGLWDYPRSGAATNYIQYLADALTISGYEVHILSGINRNYVSKDDDACKDVKLHQLISVTGNKVVDHLFNAEFFNANLIAKLRRLKLTANDAIIINSHPNLQKCAFYIKSKTNCKIISYVLEWFDKEQFESIEKWESSQKSFDKNRNVDLIWPISHHIANNFKNEKCHSLILPCLIDTSEFEMVSKEPGIYNIVMPFNGKMKDSIENMLLGINHLADDELAKVKFHIKGVTSEYIRSVLKDNYLRVEKRLKVYGWMEYKDLVSLYQSSHYIFLARGISQMTLSNFPSKIPEAMAYGVVPLCSRVGDYTEYYLADEKDSLIFDGDSPAVCCKNLQRALNMDFSEYNKLSQAARRTAEERFDYHIWANLIKDSIEGLY